MRRRAVTAMFGSGVLLAIAGPFATALASTIEDKEKPKRTIELALSIERVGDSIVTSATGLAAMEADLVLARKGAPLKKRNGRRSAHAVELTFVRPAAKDRFQELFRAWLESPDKRTAVLIVRDEGSPSDEPRGELKRWTLLDCEPKSWKVSTPDEKKHDGLTEELVVIIEWFEEA